MDALTDCKRQIEEIMTVIDNSYEELYKQLILSGLLDILNFGENIAIAYLSPYYFEKYLIPGISRGRISFGIFIITDKEVIYFFDEPDAPVNPKDRYDMEELYRRVSAIIERGYKMAINFYRIFYNICQKASVAHCQFCTKVMNGCREWMLWRN